MLQNLLLGVELWPLSSPPALELGGGHSCAHEDAGGLCKVMVVEMWGVSFSSATSGHFRAKLFHQSTGLDGIGFGLD